MHLVIWMLLWFLVSNAVGNKEIFLQSLYLSIKNLFDKSLYTFIEAHNSKKSFSDKRVDVGTDKDI